MPADYKSHVNRKKKKPMPGFVWMFGGLAIGLFIAFLVYLDKQPPSEISFSDAVKTELHKIKQHNANSSAKPKPETPAQQEPKFNFYTILPELEVLIPEDEIQPPTSKKTSGTSAPDGKRYILQAGSFRSRQDAEKLKATVALLGMEASINQVSIQNEKWHRVRIGPVSSRRELNRNLNLLHRNNINAMAMELK